MQLVALILNQTSSSSTSELVQMTLPVAPVAGILSTGFLGLGALHLLAPFRMCNIFGLPCPSTPSTEPLPRAFIYANGGREVMLSVAFFLLGKQANRDGMKALMYGTLVSTELACCGSRIFNQDQHRWPLRWIHMWCGDMEGGNTEDGKEDFGCTCWEVLSWV